MKRGGFDADFKAKIAAVESTTNDAKDKKLIRRLDAGDYYALEEIAPDSNNLAYHDDISFFSAENRVMYQTQENTGATKRHELNKISVSKRREHTQKQLSQVR